MMKYFFKRLKVVPTKVKTKNTSYLRHKEEARALIVKRLGQFNLYYKLSFNRVSIKDQKRCWGSCSSKGNLNFSYKLLFLPACLRDYVIVHELSHLRVLNHSNDFWNVVTEVMPDCRKRAKTLRRFEQTYGTSLKALQLLPHQPEACVYCQSDLAQLEKVTSLLTSSEMFSVAERNTVELTSLKT